LKGVAALSQFSSQEVRSMTGSRTGRVVVLFLGFLGCATAGRAAEGPPYRIVVRARSAEAAPEANRDGQTSGGYIEVVHRAPDTVVILMQGAVVAGAEQHRAGTAALRFALDQELEIVATRPGLRPPQLALAGQVIGTLQAKGGSAEQGPACAAVMAAGQPLLAVNLKPHAVAGEQNLFVNDREVVPEVVVLPGAYCVHQTFQLSASAPPPAKCVLPYTVPAASAVFDPDPRLEGPWIQALRAFRNVPRRDFGFSILVHVSEAPPTPPQSVPAPKAE
jgi:hypothetical protein